jgi:uncharacterized phage protein (TIGR02218 family)
MPTSSPNSAFFQRLQMDEVDLVEIIDLELPGGGGSWHFTTANDAVTYTLSGAPTKYIPFAGGTPTGVQQDSALGVSVIDFVMQNSITAISEMVANSDFSLTRLKIGRVFISTPDLGRMEVYNGQVGDFSYDRIQLKGQARNLWKSLNVEWPYYNYQDTCAWRFGSAGCGVDTTSLAVAINTLSVNSSTTIELRFPAGTLTNSYASGRFDFGRIMVTGGVNSGSERTIRAHDGDNLSLSYDLPNADFTGITFSIKPGCRKRIVEDCTSLYNNAANALAFWGIPVQEKAY